MLKVRVTPYKNVNGSYYAVQIGTTVKGRWKTCNAAAGLRRERLFCIEDNMTNNLPGEYERAKVVTKEKAEKLATEWRNDLNRLASDLFR